MGAAASRMTDAGLIKIKVNAEDPASQIEAVRRAAPTAHLIVDPNESWNIGILRDMQPVLERLCVDLLEQPLPAAADDALLGFSSCIPSCADEASSDEHRVGTGGGSTVTSSGSRAHLNKYTIQT